MSVQELCAGQIRLIKMSPSRISELRPGAQVFVLSAMSAQRKILGQFYNVKSVQADAVGIICTDRQFRFKLLNAEFISLVSVVAFAPGLAPSSGGSVGLRRYALIDTMIFIMCAITFAISNDAFKQGAPNMRYFN
jgi:hypothetical protein